LSFSKKKHEVGHEKRKSLDTKEKAEHRKSFDLAPKKSQPPVSVLSEVKDNIPLGEVPNNCSSPEEPPGVPEVKPKKRCFEV